MVVKLDDCSRLNEDKACDQNLRQIFLSPIFLILISPDLYAAAKTDPGGQEAQGPCVVILFKSENNTDGE